MTPEARREQPGALRAADIRRLLAAQPPLAAGLEDPCLQVQPNGLDLRLEAVWSLQTQGRLGRTQRAAAERRELTFDADGWLRLSAGPYVLRLCETLALPMDLMALGFARSTLLRSGCALGTAVWDAGYVGRSEVLLVVSNPAGFSVERGARVMQLVFLPLAGDTEPYSGAYQREHLPDAEA